MKIAILILLHEYGWQQEKLVTHLSKDFDVYVHVDKRTSIEIVNIQKKNVHAYKQFKVYWGHYNQILATLFLLETAHNQGYDRFIFISGEDVPLKSNLAIQSFFENNDSEYLSYCTLPHPDWPGNGGLDRIDYWHVRALNSGRVNCFESVCLKCLSYINDTYVKPLMKRWGIRRRINGLQYYGGCNWMDLTGCCVSQIIRFVRKNQWFLRKFKYSRCADEIFFQTIVCSFAKNIQIENNCLRYTDWQNCTAHPKVLRMEDYGKLKGSTCLFARKFKSEIDADIIHALYRDLEKDNG